MTMGENGIIAKARISKTKNKWSSRTRKWEVSRIRKQFRLCNK